MNITRFAGFDWRTNIALVGGFAAKEVVVSTLGTAYSLGEVDPEETGSLAEKLKSAKGWGPLTAFSLIVFTIFYAPSVVDPVVPAHQKMIAVKIPNLLKRYDDCFFVVGLLSLSSKF